MSGQTSATIRSINFDPKILKALDKKSKQSGLSRSGMVNYALAQMLGIHYEPHKSTKEETQ